MLPSLNDYPDSKNTEDCWMSSRDIDDQRILQPDWTGGTTGHKQQKVLVPDANFL